MPVYSGCAPQTEKIVQSAGLPLDPSVVRMSVVWRPRGLCCGVQARSFWIPPRPRVHYL